MIEVNLDLIKVEWIKMFGDEVDAVQGSIGNWERVLIYNDKIQSSQTLPRDIAEVKQILECYSKAIALYEAGKHA